MPALECGIVRRAYSVWGGRGRGSGVGSKTPGVPGAVLTDDESGKSEGDERDGWDGTRHGGR